MASDTLPGPATMGEGNKTLNSKGWLPLRAAGMRMKNSISPLVSPIASTQSSGNSHLDHTNFNRNTPGPITLTIHDVVNDLTIHQRFRLPSVAPGVAITDLPNFDDVMLYGVPKEVQEDLWKLEAERLVKAVIQEEGLRFHGSTELSKDSKDAYRILGGLAEKMQRSLLIISHDSERLLREANISSLDTDRYYECKDALKHISKDQDNTLDLADHQMDRPTTREGRNEDFFAFVDHCTASLARYLCSATMGTSVHVNILAHLARVCTKIKVTSADLKQSAKISLNPRRILGPERSKTTHRFETAVVRTRNGHMVSRPRDGDYIRLRTSRRLDVSPWESQREHEKESGFRTTLETKSTQSERLRFLYYEKCDNYQRTLVELLEALLSHLQGIKRTQTSSPFFEISGMVYETGFERFRTLVFQDDGQNFVGTSDTHIVNYARNAFHLLDEAVHSLQQHTEKHPGGSSVRPMPVPSYHEDEASVGTWMSWKYAPEHRESGPRNSTGHTPNTFQLDSMSDVITVLIPLLLANPSVVVPVSNFFGRLNIHKDMRLSSRSLNEHQTELFKPRIFGRYTAFVCLSTQEYYNQQQKLRHSKEPRSLSNALMRNSYLYSGDGPFRYSRVKTTLEAPQPSSRSLEPNTRDAELNPENQESGGETITLRRQELDRVGKRMTTWVFEEKGVMVKCKTYVAMTMLSAAMLAAGGLAVGVTLGPRISAVDPFNLTTYCWALAAFVILIAKSVRVKEWSWNDFLHCRVLCKSVSELASVTGIDEQLILAKLIQDDTSSILETRGPYNQVFDGRKAGDGFSIDRPIGIWAMLLSGIIMIEVETLDGRRLVSLDVRRGTKLAVVQNRGDQFYECLYSKEGQILDPTVREILGEEGQGSTTQVQLKRGELTWTRALGLYSNKEAYFV